MEFVIFALAWAGGFLIGYTLGHHAGTEES